MAQGTLGLIEFGSDFTQIVAQTTIAAAGHLLGGDLALIGVSEGTIDSTVDEPGGIIDITTDVNDNNNEFLVAGVFKPQDGGMWAEARFKIPDSVATTRAAVWFGFTETFNLTTPVMPFETATTTTTYNGTGGMVGFGMDSDASTIAFRFAAGDGGAALATKDHKGTVGGAIGITPTPHTLTADRWYVARVEVGSDGIARGYWGDLGANDKMVYVGQNTTALGVGDNFHCVLGIENRSAANERLEVDYFFGQAGRDWAAD